MGTIQSPPFKGEAFDSSIHEIENLAARHQHSEKKQDMDDIGDDEGICMLLKKKLSDNYSKKVSASKNLLENDHKTNKRQALKELVAPSNLEGFTNSQKPLDEVALPLMNRLFVKMLKNKLDFSRIKIELKQFIATKQRNIQKDYRFLKVIGEGGYGVVYQAELKNQPGEYRAVKKLQKSNMSNLNKNQIVNQFQILRICDHPNIIKIYQTYEDSNYYYIVTERCTGGNLVEFINKNQISEPKIKVIMTQILSAVKYLHDLKIIHRDLKMENVLIVEDSLEQGKNIQIKVIDFGLSLKMTQKSPLVTDLVEGTLIYMSPETLYGDLNLKSDIWSCGIILYILLTKKLPYRFKDEDQLSSKIEKGKIMRKHLQKVDFNIRTLLNLMIQRNPLKRISAEKALRCKWFSDSDNYLRISQRRRTASLLLSYGAGNNLESLIESYISFKKISQNERQTLATIFSVIDRDKNGVIDITELKTFYAQNSEFYCENEIEELLKEIDKNKSGTIDFTEFITAMHAKQQLYHSTNLEDVFDYFDVDRSGSICKREIKSILVGVKNQEIEVLFKQFDEDSNDTISKSEFFRYFRTSEI